MMLGSPLCGFNRVNAIESRNDCAVDSVVLDYVIPWPACRAVALCEGGTTESTTYFFFLIGVAIRNAQVATQ